MAGGSFRAPLFAVAWPTGEFGGMSIEGAVKLGFRNELAAIEDPAESRARIMASLNASPPPPPRAGKKRPNIDTW